MQYKAVINSSPYIMHFNKNHNPANGQFAPGDGDGDGIVNDHKYAYSILDYDPGKEFVEQHNRNVQEQAFRDFTDTAARNHQDMVNQAIINEGQRFMEEMNRNQMLQQRFF